MNMINIKGFVKIPAEQRKFINDFLNMFFSFQFNVEIYRGPLDNLPIQNTDLWIESYIELVPDLQEFRDYVRSEMERLGIEKHPNYAYQKKFNHYYYSNERTIEKLRNSINNETEQIDCGSTQRPDNKD